MLNKSFNVRYQGFALTRFLHHVAICAKMYKANVHYGKVIAILQASATGKSRLVKELSNVVSPFEIAESVPHVHAGVPDQHLLSSITRAKCWLASW
jgi:hypothetical protein